MARQRNISMAIWAGAALAAAVFLADPVVWSKEAFSPDETQESVEADLRRIFEADDPRDARLEKAIEHLRAGGTQAIPAIKRSLESDRLQVQAAALAGLSVLGTLSEPLAGQAA